MTQTQSQLVAPITYAAHSSPSRVGAKDLQISSKTPPSPQFRLATALRMLFKVQRVICHIRSCTRTTWSER